MKLSRTEIPHCLLLASLILSGVALAPVRAAAQQGNKAVYQAGNTLYASTAWVDASAFCGTDGTDGCANVDFCSMVSMALGKLPASGGVVDARGVLPVPTNGSAEQCKSNPFPSTLGSVPITILLPACSILLNDGAWVIPNNVKLVGAGLETVLVNQTSPAPPYMIEMGSNCGSTSYNGIAIEHLQLNTSSGGIDNQCAGSGSYINDVKVTGISATQSLAGAAFNIGPGPGATNSGPYTDLYVVAVPSVCTGNSNASCAVVGAQTRGIHGMTCVGSSATATAVGQAGIVVNASNNSIENVHVESFYDGIQINPTLAPVSNISVSDIEAGYTNCKMNGQSYPGGVQNTVHICSTNSTTTCGSPVPTYGSSDIVLLGVSNGPYAQSPFNSIQDDQTGTTIAGCNGLGCMDPITSGIYILGSQPYGDSTGPYSRFAINPANNTIYGNQTTVVPTWGTGSPSASIQGTSCATPGAIYSNTGNTGSGSVYVCMFVSATVMEWESLP